MQVCYYSHTSKNIILSLIASLSFPPLLPSLLAFLAINLSLSLLVMYLLPVQALSLTLSHTAPSYSRPHQHASRLSPAHQLHSLCFSQQPPEMQDITTGTVNSFGTLNRNFGAEYLQGLKDAVIQIYVPKCVFLHSCHSASYTLTVSINSPLLTLIL